MFSLHISHYNNKEKFYLKTSHKIIHVWSKHLVDKIDTSRISSDV